ncbi:Low-density lipoprotein receptor-related protein 1 [Thelohanellus kitauei]|uniref:Low-density lipoprotein receptor-related protein 1 n=1 Tax=Thelohanellus kitauei TaxID=669202 RepID=A0A0C2N4P9_THEKT|nr:Low-density lipoprotein receptor-related protein 1 [Thelohanellus kitauei]
MIKMQKLTIACPLSRSIRCKDEEGCYDKSQQCDGFNDCSDGSDEKICQSTTSCIGDEFFTCDTDSEICISRVCDGFKDCDDGSDEGPICRRSILISETYDNVKNVSFDIRLNGVVYFSWIHERSAGQLDVTIQDM